MAAAFGMDHAVRFTAAFLAYELRISVNQTIVVISLRPR